jgi:hypothetical protein
MGKEDTRRLVEIGQPKLGELVTAVSNQKIIYDDAEYQAKLANAELARAKAQADSAAEKLAVAKIAFQGLEEQRTAFDSAVEAAKASTLSYEAGERLLANTSTRDDDLGNRLMAQAQELETYARGIIEPPLAPPADPPPSPEDTQ